MIFTTDLKKYLRYSRFLTQEGVVTLEKVVPSIQVIVLLLLSRNPSLHDTVSSVPVSTGNVVSVVRWFQAGSSPVHSVDFHMST